jgi:uncharacterized membrane protein YccF (DUF307 family)
VVLLLVVLRRCVGIESESEQPAHFWPLERHSLYLLNEIHPHTVATAVAPPAIAAVLRCCWLLIDGHLLSILEILENVAAIVPVLRGIGALWLC